MKLGTSDLTKRIARLAVNPTPSTRILLCIGAVVTIGTWRHYDTALHPDAFQQEVWIQWLSWVFVYISLRLLRVSAVSGLRVQHDKSFWSSNYALWIGSAFAVISQFLSSQRNLTWILPLTTIAVSLSGKTSSTFDENDSAYQEDVTSIFTCFGSSREAIRSLLIRLVMNSICFIIFAVYQGARTTSREWPSIFGNSVLFLITRSAMIVIFSRLRRSAELVEEEDLEEEKLEAPATTNASEWLHSLSTPMLAILTLVLVFVRPQLEISNAGLVAHAAAQSIWWTALIVLIRSQLINTAANLDTVSLSAQISLTEINVKFIGMAMAAGYLAIAQSTLALRLEIFARRIVYGICGVFLFAIWIRHDPRLFTNTYSSSKQTYNIHPIEDLITKGRSHFAALEARQSKTVDEAAREYRRRYGRSPPLGFDKWFEIAKANNFVLIDEFDTFMESLEPYHGVDAYVLKQRLDAALKSDGGRMSAIRFSNNNATTDPQWADWGMKLLNATWTPIVPYNMTIALNGWDESMVSAAWIDVNKAVKEAKNPDRNMQMTGSAHVNGFVETGKQSGWAATMQACSINSPSRQVECPARKLTSSLPFTSNVTETRNVCLNCEIINEHGLLLSPDNMRVSHELVPVWSHSKPSHFNDLLFPSGYYIDVRDNYKPKLDSHWADKDNKFYWVGSATGGHATKTNWNHMQRQRLVLKTMKTNTDPVQLLEEIEPGSNKWQPRYSSFSEIAELFETRIAGIGQCTDEACDIEEAAFGNPKDREHDPQEAAYSHKFVMDIDGNGFSGRYYRLLQSRSAVIKMTILKEWHDDRLVPWVHYIPLSTSYAELPEMARFLATTDKGLELSERIARESTDWHNKALRDVDLRLVFLRMALEFGRVMNPDLPTYH